MVSARRGGSTLGCLFSIFVVVALGYFIAQFGEAFLRAYRYEDAMKNQVRLAGSKTNPEIKTALRAVADSLGVPEEGQEVGVARTSKHIAIWADYYEHIELPFNLQPIPFHPHAEGSISADSTSRRR